MSEIAWIILGPLLWIVALEIVRRTSYRNGMRDGLQLGHDRGKAEAHDWWLTAEEEIEATRREMWRERR